MEEKVITKMNSNEIVVKIKICKDCWIKFEITSKDLEFYEKISPVFGGRKFNIPWPTLCPNCRQQRRLAFRNENFFYKRKCDKTWDSMISIYSPDKQMTVYNKKYWWSDDWDSLDYGREFDFSRWFFDQFSDLIKVVPFLNVFVTLDSQNSDYGNHAWKLKDCYCISASWICERTMYSSKAINTDLVVDCIDITNVENSYELVNCEKCYGCLYVVNSNNCDNCMFLYWCENCKDCFMCYNIVWKQYCIQNKQYSKHEYLEKLFELKNQCLWKWFDVIREIIWKSVNKNLMMVNVENCLWDNLVNSKNCYATYHATNIQDCKYVDNAISWTDMYDWYWVWDNLSLWYEMIDVWINSTQVCFLAICHRCKYTFYSINCYDSNYLFGCVGLRNKEYCILNKQHTKEEYEELVPKIIEHMSGLGNKKNGKIDQEIERGEFFPINISPFGYNETIAVDSFPMSRQDALNKWYKWQDKDYPVNIPEWMEKVNWKDLPQTIDQVDDSILNKAIICEITWKPFRIIKQELEFYRKHEIPLPKYHPYQRYLDRFSLRNLKKLYDRKCDKCQVDMKTTYSENYEWKVFCQKCYDKEVYW